MRILHQDAQANLVRVRPDSMDDLYHLAQIVRKGDLATAVTQRTPDLGDKDKARAGKAEKRTMTLTIRVETIEFAVFSNRLRLLGPIVEGPQDLGMYHTLNVEERVDLAIVKPSGWRDHELLRLKESIDATEKPRVTFLAIEENEAVVAVLRQYGVQKMADIVGHQSGKRFASSGRDEEAFFDEILLALRDYRGESSPLMIVGPGFAKERFMDHARAKQPDLVKGAAVEGTGQAGMAGVQEAIRRGVVDRVAKENRVALETRAVESFLEALATNAPAAYGPVAIERALEAGAVDLLLVTDAMLRGGGEGETPAERWLALAKRSGGRTLVVSAVHEAGLKLAALGGAGATLRYRLET
ncbi:MAG TPA: mRNA surveillance protein pelota [Candidatus Thermoplasmatota archaeon]|nr:mRNA surveillance protein pelota [Candidatus Thermoplasmatota archaeon]